MEHNGRKLAWVAIALSVVALMVSLGGRAQSSWAGFHGPMAPQAQVGPQGQAGPQGPMMGMRGRRGQQGQQPQAPQPPQPGADQRFGNDFRGPQGFGRPGRMGGMPFFFLPFLLIGKLIKLVFVVGLIWLGFRLIRGRGFGRPGGRGPWGGNGGSGPGPERGPWNEGGPKQPPQPDPEQPPYTGDTRQI